VLLLVADGAARLEAWREGLGPLGLDLCVARPPGEALKLFGRRHPAWVVVAPACAQGRGRALYAELRRHPYAARARFVLLGEPLPGHEGPVWPVEADAEAIRARVAALLGPGGEDVQRDSGTGPRGATAASPLADEMAVVKRSGVSTAAGATGATPPAWQGAPEVPAAGTVNAATPEGRGTAKQQVISLPPTLGPGAGEESCEAFCRRLLGWSARQDALRVTAAEGEGPARTLLLQGGAWVFAESAAPAESLLERARLDGLITAAECVALNAFRRAGPDVQLAELRARGWVREEEAGPLWQRSVRAVGLAALSAARVRFTVAPAVVDAAGGGPGVGEVVLEALRRRAEPETWLERAGGRQARIRPVPNHVELDALGLPERERAWVRSWEAAGGTVEALLLGAGIREHAGLVLLQSLEACGVFTVEPPDHAAPASVGEREVVRLQEKLSGLERADYFEVLGLSRTAGTAEVLRAWGQLRAEFEPLRYVGHPDVGLVQDAQRVCEALDEAARALRDDGLRAAYARYLVG